MLTQDKGLKIAQKTGGYHSAAALLHVLCGSPRLWSSSNRVYCLLSQFTSVTESGTSAFFLTHFSFPYVRTAVSHGGPSISLREQCRPSLATSFSLPPRQSSSVQTSRIFFTYIASGAQQPARAPPRCATVCGIDIIFRPKSFELTMFFPRHPTDKFSHRYLGKKL